MLPRKVVVVAIATFAILVAVFYITKTAFLDSFVKLEEKRVQRNIERTLGVLSSEISALDETAADWAGWDDSCDFVENANQEFILNNFADITFARLRLNMMLFISPTGRVVYGKGFDLTNKKEMPVPDSVLEHLSAGSILISHTGTESCVKGILSLPEGPVLVVSRPILTSLGEGPIRGTLVMGRYLDDAEIKRLAGITQVSLSVHRINEGRMPPDYQEALSLLSEDRNVVIRPLDGDISGYTLLKDVYGNPGLVLRINIPMEVYNQSKAIMLFFILLFLVICLMIVMLIMLLMENREREMAEKALRKSEASLANAQRIAHLGSWDWDIVKDELIWSDEIYRIFCLSPRKYGATCMFFLDSVHPEDRDFVKKSLDDALYTGMPCLSQGGP